MFQMWALQSFYPTFSGGQATFSEGSLEDVGTADGPSNPRRIRSNSIYALSIVLW